MKTISITSLAILLFCFTVNAQHIPDNNFAEAIRKKCASCIDDNNNLLPAAKSIEKLDVQQANITSLEGVEGFTDLAVLDCSYNENITSLPRLPVKLKDLWIRYTQINKLSSLPPALEVLGCEKCPLTSLPALPATLKYLFCEKSGLTSLPPLPESLYDMECSFSPISILPKLPAGLHMLEISGTKITKLPQLPDGLAGIKISDSTIDCIPTNNASLWIRDYYGNAVSTPICKGNPKPATALAANKNKQPAAATDEKGKCLSGNCKNGIGTFAGLEDGKHVTYKGNFKNGIYNGFGTMTVSGGFKYTGSFRDGKMNGKGVLTLDNGQVYTGEMQDDKMNGTGTMAFKDGRRSTGLWKQNKFWTGTGLLKYGENDFYYGGVKENEADGQGVRTYPNGKKFTGTFDAGNPVNGNGYALLTDNSSIEGTIVNGKLNGYNIVKYPDGSVYKGNWTAGIRNGRGDLLDADGNLDYSGDWVDGRMTDPTASAAVKRTAGKYFRRINFKGDGGETLTDPDGNEHYGAVEISLELYLENGVNLHGTMVRTLTIGDKTYGKTYTRKISVTGTFSIMDFGFTLKQNELIYYDTVPNFKFPDEESWTGKLYEDQVHEGYYILKGKNSSDREFHLTDRL